MTQTPVDPRDSGFSYGAVYLLLIAVIAVLAGLAFLSQATWGVGLLVLACFMGICARLAQAGQQHRVIVRILRERQSG